MISPGFVQDALASLTRQGLETGPALAAAGIGSAAEPVSTQQYGRLWLAITQMTGDEFFGLGARPMRPGAFNLMCQTVLHARTLEHALRRALNFLRVVLDDPAGHLRQHDGRAEITLSAAQGPQPAFAYRSYWLILMGVLCWLVGRRIPLMQVDFAGPAPENRRDYHDFFGAPVRFDQPQSRLIFAAHYLALTPIRSEKALQSFLRGAPANILIRYRHDQGLAARIRARLRAAAPEDWPDFDRLAAELRLSPATLRRRLRSEGQGFATMREEIRHAQARRLLVESQARVAEIATRLGYAEPSAFHRAFLKWSGTTPAAFRAAATRAAGRGESNGSGLG